MLGGAIHIGGEVYSHYLTGLLAGDGRECKRLLLRLLDDGLPIQAVYEDLFQRSLYDVGELRERNQISIASEHIATAITENLLNTVLPYALPIGSSGRRVLVAGVSPERHQIGAKIVADFFEMNGWDSVYAGTNIAPDDLIRLVTETKADLLALSATMFFNAHTLDQLMSSLRAHVPHVHTAIGGQGLRLRIGERLALRHEGVSYLRSLNDLKVFLSQRAS